MRCRCHHVNAGFVQVRHDDVFHRVRLAEIYRWAQARPDAYLEGSGYESREDFYQSPQNATEFFVEISARPVALLTFLPLTAGEYRIGLITAPNAPVRRLVKLLGIAREELRASGVRVLWVRLPGADCYDGARKLAAKIGFTRLNEADWKLELTDGNTRKESGPEV